MGRRDQDVHFLASKEEVQRIHEKMDELGIRSMGAYLRKMALDGYCINLDLQDVKELVSLLRRCSNNLNQYAMAKRKWPLENWQHQKVPKSSQVHSPMIRVHAIPRRTRRGC